MPKRVLDIVGSPSKGQGHTAGFHPDQTRWQIDEKLGHLVPPQLLLENRLTQLVNTVKLEYILCQVDAYCRDYHDGCSCYSKGCYATPLWHTTVPPKVGAFIPLLWSDQVSKFTGSSESERASYFSMLRSLKIG
jgi:hypothetical protein